MPSDRKARLLPAKECPTNAGDLGRDLRTEFPAQRGVEGQGLLAQIGKDQLSALGRQTYDLQRFPRGPMPYGTAPKAGLEPKGGAEPVIRGTNYHEVHYSTAQELAHRTTSGCQMSSGDR